MTLWHRFISWLMRTVFFRIRVVGEPIDMIPKPGRRRIILCSHRNGATDGFVIQKLFPQAVALVSLQLLRHWFLRLLFTGIPVIRAKDKLRYGLTGSEIDNPVVLSLQRLREGYPLMIFPEGSSEWGAHPLPYEQGVSRLVRLALRDGEPVEIIPLGLFYIAPDRFRSRVEILAGQTLRLVRQPDHDKREEEAKIHATLAAALDCVSVNCPDMEAFTHIEVLAKQAYLKGDSYAEAFKRFEQGARVGFFPCHIPQMFTQPTLRKKQPIFYYPCQVAFLLLFAPVVLAAWLTGRQADARNTVTLFRMLGTMAAGLLWLPALCGLTVFYPLILLPLLMLAVPGWVFWPEHDHE